MADEYQNAVKKLMDYLDQTAVFAKGELPDVANQMLVYGATMGQFWLTLWCVVAAVSVGLWLLYMAFADSEHIPGKIITGIMALIFVCVAGQCWADLVKIRTAPKLYIMEAMGDMLKAQTCGKR